MTKDVITLAPIILPSDKADILLTQGLEWWQNSGGIIGRDQATTRILENLQISVIQREDRIPPLIHAGNTSVTAQVFGHNWAETCTGSTLPDAEFDLAVTESYIKVLEDNKPVAHEVVAPLVHPVKGNCLVSYQRLLLPCRFKSGGNVIGSITSLKSFYVEQDIPNHDAPSTPANR
ncbi:hypothetical protein [Kiloniella majae]|uniref:hypothetical protein n=1 Tax=Kiloniella majae TaxID=1938558 RepID=UPI000A279841|nr:hypothetical protein [Kiloniella majae]